MNDKKLGIYLHIPFCKSRCVYCDFVSSVAKAEDMDCYVNRLCSQIKDEGARYSDCYTVDTVYFGGGTPTLLSEENLSRLSEEIKRNFKLDIKEFTVEANPCTVDVKKLSALKESGVTRLSIGVQTFNDRLLKMLGRRHDRLQAINAIKIAKELGFDVSADCMLALPKQTFEDVKEFVEIADGLGVEHISAYMLSVEEGTPLQKLIDDKTLVQKSDDESAEFYDYICSILKDKGYRRYEVSNFCKNNKTSAHNLKYWQRKDYLGMGLSAHSLIDGVRWRCANNFEEYYRLLDKNQPIRLDREVLSEEDKKSEFIMLALRLKEGLDVEEYEMTFGVNFAKEYSYALKKNSQFILFDSKRLWIKEEYIKVMNSIVVDFLK